jgi:hypothetical protein
VLSSSPKDSAWPHTSARSTFSESVARHIMNPASTFSSGRFVA